MTLTLQGLAFKVHSPSLYSHLDRKVLIGFNGSGWQIAVRGRYGSTEFTTRDQAIAIVAREFNQARLTQGESR